MLVLLFHAYVAHFMAKLKLQTDHWCQSLVWFRNRHQILAVEKTKNELNGLFRNHSIILVNILETKHDS
jgi:hypothetical protein